MEARPARFCSLCLVPSKRCLRNKQSYYTIATTYNKDMSNKSLVVKMPLLSGLMNRRPILYVYTEAASLPKCIAKCVRCAGENRVRSVYSFFVQFKVVPGWVECCGRWPSTWRRGPGINNVVTTTTMPTQDRHLINHTRARVYSVADTREVAPTKHFPGDSVTTRGLTVWLVGGNSAIGLVL